jgi:hypothetical protein
LKFHLGRLELQIERERGGQPAPVPHFAGGDFVHGAFENFEKVCVHPNIA